MLGRVDPRVLRQVLELGTYEIANGDQVGVGAVVFGSYLGHLIQRVKHHF